MKNFFNIPFQSHRFWTYTNNCNKNNSNRRNSLIIFFTNDIVYINVSSFMNHFILHNLSNPLLIIIYQNFSAGDKSLIFHAQMKNAYFIASTAKTKRTNFIWKSVNNFQIIVKLFTIIYRFISLPGDYIFFPLT